MKYAALALITSLIAGPALANKLHQEQPTASEVKAWQADHAKIKQQEQKKKKHKKHKKHSSAASGQVKETVGGHQHNK
jgi:hypothetical protein